MSERTNQPMPWWAVMKHFGNTLRRMGYRRTFLHWNDDTAVVGSHIGKRIHANDNAGAAHE